MNEYQLYCELGLVERVHGHYDGYVEVETARHSTEAVSTVEGASLGVYDLSTPEGCESYRSHLSGLYLR